MDIAIEPSGPVSFDLAVPGSKSLTNRALVCAALSAGTSRITNASFSDDSRILTAALGGMGIDVETREGELLVRGCGGSIPGGGGTFSMGNAGTALRFFTSFACLARGRCVVDGDERMRERPLRGLVDALRGLGAEIAYLGKEGFPPVEILAKGLRGGHAEVSGATSSQFVTSLLMAAPAADGEVVIEVTGEITSKPYIEITLDVMRGLGVEVEREGFRRFRVAKDSAYRAGDFAVEADGASAGYFMAMAAATGGRAVVRGIGSGSHQGEIGFAGVLEKMGCRVERREDSIVVEGGVLSGVDVDMNDMPDSVQTLACTALFAKGPTRVRNVANLRIKETDRIAAVARELTKLGAQVEEGKDGFSMIPPGRVTPASIDTYNDHRMAMCFAVAATAAPGIVIRDVECVSKSFPGFFDLLESLGVKLQRNR